MQAERGQFIPVTNNLLFPYKAYYSPFFLCHSVGGSGHILNFSAKRKALLGSTSHLSVCMQKHCDTGRGLPCSPTTPVLVMVTRRGGKVKPTWQGLKCTLVWPPPQPAFLKNVLGHFWKQGSVKEKDPHTVQWRSIQTGENLSDRAFPHAHYYEIRQMHRRAKPRSGCL